MSKHKSEIQIIAILKEQEAGMDVSAAENQAFLKKEHRRIVTKTNQTTQYCTLSNCLNGIFQRQG